ncbi:hypothetical protein GQ607_009636 [Colletotrichum asianum]|uniref:Uncharacterized protein n=1 Tax=Colletotrichum asianum TaxID=702518 RepID=A0A8H3ZPM5_9PEZI|nr:hypothetical protein GQ607_009636 [Colletotrichum asianum]
MGGLEKLLLFFVSLKKNCVCSSTSRGNVVLARNCFVANVFLGSWPRYCLGRLFLPVDHLSSFACDPNPKSKNDKIWYLQTIVRNKPLDKTKDSSRSAFLAPKICIRIEISCPSSQKELQPPRSLCPLRLICFPSLIRDKRVNRHSRLSISQLRAVTKKNNMIKQNPISEKCTVAMGRNNRAKVPDFFSLGFLWGILSGLLKFQVA